MANHAHRTAPFISDFVWVTDLQIGDLYHPDAELHFEMRDERDPEAGLLLMGWMYGDLRIDRDMAEIATSRAYVESLEQAAFDRWYPNYWRNTRDYERGYQEAAE